MTLKGLTSPHLTAYLSAKGLSPRVRLCDFPLWTVGRDTSSAGFGVAGGGSLREFLVSWEKPEKEEIV